LTIKDEEYILALPLDLEIAVKIVQGAMAETVLGLERDVKELYECLAEEKNSSGFTYKELMTIYEKHFGESVSKTTMRDRYVEKLEDSGLVEVDDSKKPHKISVLPESSASLANFEKAIEQIRSDETKAKITSKISANPLGVQAKILHSAIDEKFAYRLSDFADLFKLLERTKSEEYPEKTFFSDSAKDADDFQQLDGEGDKDLGQGSTVKNEVKGNSVQEVLERIRGVFVEGTEEEWLSLARENGLSANEAESLFESLKSEELFWFDREGKTYWRWVRS
jgi:hypothetical protein